MTPYLEFARATSDASLTALLIARATLVQQFPGVGLRPVGVVAWRVRQS